MKANEALYGHEKCNTGGLEIVYTRCTNSDLMQICPVRLKKQNQPHWDHCYNNSTGIAMSV